MYESFGSEEVAVTVTVTPDHREPKFPHVIQSQIQDGPVIGKRSRKIHRHPSVILAAPTC